MASAAAAAAAARWLGHTLPDVGQARLRLYLRHQGRRLRPPVCCWLRQRQLHLSAAAVLTTYAMCCGLTSSQRCQPHMITCYPTQARHPLAVPAQPPTLLAWSTRRRLAFTFTLASIPLNPPNHRPTRPHSPRTAPGLPAWPQSSVGATPQQNVVRFGVAVQQRQAEAVQVRPGETAQRQPGTTRGRTRGKLLCCEGSV